MGVIETIFMYARRPSWYPTFHLGLDCESSQWCGRRFVLLRDNYNRVMFSGPNMIFMFSVAHLLITRSDPSGRQSAGETPNSVSRRRRFVHVSMTLNWEYCTIVMLNVEERGMENLEIDEMWVFMLTRCFLETHDETAGIGCKHIVIIHMVSLKLTSSFFCICTRWLGAYSTTIYTIASVLVWSQKCP